MELIMTKKQATTINILVITVIVLIMMVSGRFWFRLDLTKDKLFTISDVSRNLHTEIYDQIQITYFLSDRLKTMHPMPGEIEDLLREYAAYSRGKIRVTVRDPVKADLASFVEQIGIMPQQIQSVEQDQASIMTVYSGILIEHLNQTDVLPVVFSLDTLEYDLTSRIRAMVRDSVRELGVIFGENPRTWNEEYRFLQNTLRQAGYQLRMIFPGDDIPDSLPALMVIGGVETFDETALYQIDRYIQTGGRVFFAVKSTFVNVNEGLECISLEDFGLLEMIYSYGVMVLPEITMDRTALLMQYQTEARQIRIARNPQWIRVQGENGNSGHPVSSRFSGLDLFYANPLVLNAPPGVEAEFLFSSTPNAWSMREPFVTNPDMSFMMERDMAETAGQKILGASLTGNFPSFFAGMPKPDREDGQELPDMPDETKPARIIVIGETGFISTFLGVSNSTQNLEFIVQISDWLSNDDDIIGIRNRQTGSGRLDKFDDDEEKKAAAMRTAQAVNIILIPLLVIIAGVAYALTRRAKAKSRAIAESNAGQDNGEKECHDDV